MKIPSNLVERQQFYADLIGKCMATRNERREMYEVWRSYYLFGSQNNNVAEARFNKIYGNVQLLSSFMYAQDSTRFNVDLGSSVMSDDPSYKYLPLINRIIADNWLNNNYDQRFSEAVPWSLTYGTMIVKLTTRGKSTVPYLLEPHNFGVLREDINSLDMQEAVCQTYTITKSELVNNLEGHPQKDRILREVATTLIQQPSETSGMDRIMSPGQIGTSNTTGNADAFPDINSSYRPKVDVEVIEMSELYVYDDDIQDYRVVTTADPGIVVFDRPCEVMFMKGEYPFIQVCPNPLYNYFWGQSEVEGVIPLQDLINRRHSQLSELIEKNVDPPKAAYGMDGNVDERLDALFTAGGTFANEDVTKVEEFAPHIPDQLWSELAALNEAMLDHFGLTNVLQGRGESGVRSTGHAKQLQNTGSTRAKKRSMVIEDCLEKAATLMFKSQQEHDDTKYKVKGGEPFMLSQLSKDYVVMVDAHSNSPIFVEDQRSLAFDLFKTGIITKQRLVEMVNPPMKDSILQELETVIIPADEQRAKMQQAEVAAKIEHKGK